LILDAWQNFFHDPIVQVLAWVLMAVFAVYGLPARFRLLSISAGGAIVITSDKAIDAYLVAATGPTDLIAITEILILLAGLILFFGPIAIAFDRLVRIAWRAIARRGDRFWSYALAAATGLAATAASLGGLYWVNDVRSGLQGSLDLAIYGGVFASCIALIRADRQLDLMSGERPSEDELERTSQKDAGDGRSRDGK